MKNSLHQTVFLNAPESERIFPKSVLMLLLLLPGLPNYSQNIDLRMFVIVVVVVVVVLGHSRSTRPIRATLGLTH